MSRSDVNPETGTDRPGSVIMPAGSSPLPASPESGRGSALRRMSRLVGKPQEDSSGGSGGHSAAQQPDMAASEEQLADLDGYEVLAEVAHDLRSPLTSILTLAETLRAGASGEVNDLQKRQLGLIYSAALALSTTASDVIEFTHGGDSLSNKEMTAFSVHELLESVIDIVRPMAEERGLELRTIVRVNDRRLGYPLALSRVLLNLTSNALKFTEKGHVELAVQPGSDTDRALMSVRDTGRGISFEALSTLFQPFQRAPRSSGHRFSGTGLGLLICRRLVRAMGSELELETRRNWGTRFYFGLALPEAGDR